jgi:peptidoglycan/LPS O-acetylase OafA/YrhL
VHAAFRRRRLRQRTIADWRIGLNVSSETAREPHGHIPSLDGVRGVAILLVLLFHFKDYLIGPEMLQGALGLAGYLGWAGVDLFFVLSGFLITRILLAARSNEGYFSSFYTRRFFRIFPLYYAVLFLIFLGPWSVIAGVLPPVSDHVWYWTYLSNWSIMLKSANPQGVGHFWSLAVEEQFYMAWPLLVWWLDGRALFRVTVALCAAAPLWRIVLISKHWDPEWIYRNTFSRMDTLLVGAAVAISFSAGQRATPLRSWVSRPALSFL